MNRCKQLCVKSIAFIALLAVPSSRAHCDDLYYRLSAFASGNGHLAYIAAGVGLPFIEDGRKGRQVALRVGDAILSSTLFSEALKGMTRDRRPNGGRRDSFPSGHATDSFAIATVESAFHPRQAPLWYAGATLIAASRVKLHQHKVDEVVAGAALGYLTARWELSTPHGLLLTPWIRPRGQGAGLSISTTF